MGRFKKKQPKKKGKQRMCGIWPKCRCIARGRRSDCKSEYEWRMRSMADRILHP